MSLAWILLVLCIITMTSSQSVNLKSQRLTQVPEGINNVTLHLYLSHNQIVTVDPERIQHLYRITRLYLDSNKLTSFPDLRAIGNTLTHLYLQYNEIAHLNYDYLDALKKLIHLEIRRNLLTSFPDPPGPGQTLRTLYIYENRITTFPNLTNVGANLENLAIRNNQIDEVKESCLFGMGRFKTIAIESNQLVAFPNFTYVKTTIEYINLQNNKISYVPSQLLNQLVKLKTLYLTQNQLTTFPNLQVLGNTLVSLRIDHNLFQVFPQLSETGKKLTYFSINNNNFNSTSMLVIDSLPLVSDIQLSSIKLKFFPNFTGSAADNLKKLYLTGNEISSVPAELLDHLTKLERLYLGGNKLVSFSESPGPSNTLIELQLYSNALVDPPTLDVMGQKLQVIGLQNNKIQNVAKEWFQNLQQLKHLHLHQNKIATFPDMGKVRDIVEYVELSSNLIEEVSADFFNFTGNTKSSLRIKLNHNRLTHISPIDAPNVRSVSLEVANNLFQCDAKMLVFLANEFKITYNIICSTPTELKGRKVTDLTLIDLKMPVIEVLLGDLSSDWKEKISNNNISSCATISPGTRRLGACSPFPAVFVAKLTRTKILEQPAVIVNLTYSGRCQPDVLSVYTASKSTTTACSAFSGPSQQQAQICPLVSETQTTAGWTCKFRCATSGKDVYVAMKDERINLQLCHLTYHKAN